MWGSGKWGIRIPQQILGVTADGQVGNKTIAAINAANQKHLFDSIYQARVNFLSNLVLKKPSQPALARRSGATAYFVQGDVHPSFDQCAFARRMMSQVPELAHLVVVRGIAGPGELDMHSMQSRLSPAAAREIVRPSDPGIEDVAMFQMSGGSTGLPKLIPRYHAEYLGHARAIAQRYGLTEDDKALWSLAMSEHRISEYALVLMGVLFIASPWVMGFESLDNMALTAWIAGAVTVVAGVLGMPQVEDRMHMHHGPIAH